MISPRRLFVRVFLQNALTLACLLATGGAILDGFLARNEVERLGNQVERVAILFREHIAPIPNGGALQAAAKREGELARVRLTVVEPSGRILADSEGDPSAMDNHAGRPEIAAALAGRVGHALRRSATLGIDMLYVAVPGPRIVRVAVPYSEVRSILHEVRERIALAAVPAAVLALLLAYVLSRSLTGRVARMKHFAAAIARGEFDRELRPAGDDELSDMERSLGALRDEIRDRVSALRREKETLSTLIEGLPHAILVFDGEEKLSLANAPARALLRLTSDQAAGLPAGEVIRNPRVLEALDGLHQKACPPEPFRLSWLDPPGEFEVSARLLPDSDGDPALLLILRDITREAHLERVRTDFITNLSHEVRTPLTAIRGSAETLLDAALSDPAAARKFLETIRRNAMRLESLLLDVSDLVRAESATVPLETRAFDGRTVVGNVTDLFAGEAQKVGVRLEKDVPERPVPVSSDEGKIESILINLVQNGLRYTPGGGRVVVALAASTGGVEYRVTDTGVGIPPKDLPRVTERFYRVDPGRSRAVGGTGLGLSIVKHLVELLGGTLEIQSEHGKGTTVRVFVPSNGGE